MSEFTFMKIQCEILKDVEKYHKGKDRFEWHYCDIGEKAFITDGHAAVIIPKEELYLDAEKIPFGRTIEKRGVDQYLNDKGLVELELRSTFEQKMGNRTRKICLLKSKGNTEKFYVNKAYVDWFKEFKGAQGIVFKGDYASNRVLVYWFDVCVGLILIIRGVGVEKLEE